MTQSIVHGRMRGATENEFRAVTLSAIVQFRRFRLSGSHLNNQKRHAART
jgi:hypothetical protein